MTHIGIVGSAVSQRSSMKCQSIGDVNPEPNRSCRTAKPICIRLMS
jgi:hypothetical protein